MDQFVNRLDELDRLQALYESDAVELAIIYGRRQIGKSDLVRQLIADRDDAVYYDVLSNLEDDMEHIDWTPKGGDEPTYEFALFSRSGFKRSVEEAADERDDLRLFDLSDIVAILERD
jgi:AAA+ ATPase superfamily predicted ATPase